MQQPLRFNLRVDNKNALQIPGVNAKARSDLFYKDNLSGNGLHFNTRCKRGVSKAPPSTLCFEKNTDILPKYNKARKTQLQ